MAYDYYKDIQNVLNAKVGWNTATTDEEKQKQNEIATAARKRLEDYRYGDIAKQISAEGADATTTRKILEQYAPKPTYTDNDLINKNNNEVNQKVNKVFDIQANDREVMAGKYNKLEDTAYSNPFETEEGKAIMGKYDLSAMQGRDNVVASGGAANGGNIDSYAAANALRQQAALINKGQMVVLDAHNNKINNVKGILESLGVYQQNQDKGMQTTIGIQQEEGQRLFENDQTAKNNDVARKAEIANITGIAPDEWVVSNNPYMNEDGTIKDEYKDIDFTTVMAKAKETGNTKAYNAAATARFYKIMSDYGTYGQYDDGNYIVPGEKQTEAGRQFDVNADITRESLKTEKDINDANLQTEKEINEAKAQHEKDLLYLQQLGVTEDEIKAMDNAIDIINKTFKDNTTGKSTGDLITNYGNGSYAAASNVSVSSWIDPVVKMLYENGNISMEQMEYILDTIGFGDKYRERKNSGALDYIFK